MIENLPPEARSEHALILLVIAYQPDTYTDSKTLMKATRIHNRNTFFRTLKDLESWGFIAKNGRFEKYHIDTSKAFVSNPKPASKYQNDTSSKNAKYQSDTIKSESKYQYDTSEYQSDTDFKAVDKCEKPRLTESYAAVTGNSHAHVYGARTELVNLLTSEKEKRGLGEKEKTFGESSIGNWEVFQSTFSTPEFSGIDLRHYFDKLRYWSDENGQPVISKNWTNAARSIMRKDWKNGNLQRVQTQPTYR